MRLVFIFVAIILNGCAVMDTSILETAETLEKGHFKFGLLAGSGLDLSLATVLDDTTGKGGETKELFLVPVAGASFGYGFGEKTELNAKLWGSFYSIGSKIYVKRKLPSVNENISMVLMPGISYITFIDIEDEYENETGSNLNIISYGAFIPLLAHYKFKDYLYFYGAVRYSIDYLKALNEEKDVDKSLTFHRLGVTLGSSLEYKAIYLRPEVGIGAVKVFNGHFGYTPTFNLGIGFQF